MREVAELKLSTIILFTGGVDMLDRCHAWYTSFGLEETSAEPGESYWFDTGDGHLLGLHTSAETPSAGVSLHFNVADTDESYARLSAVGFTFESEPESKVWGGRVAYLRDPVGNQVGIVSFPARSG